MVQFLARRAAPFAIATRQGSRGLAVKASPAEVSAKVETAKLIDEAAKRASRRVKPRGWFSRNREVIAVGIAGMVAVTALNRRREMEEKISLQDAHMLRLERERDDARGALATAEKQLLDAAPAAIAAFEASQGWFKSPQADRVEAFRAYVRTAFSDESLGSEKDKDDSPPTMV